MKSTIEKIKRTVRYAFYKYKNSWYFPSNIPHLTGGKMAKGIYEPKMKSIVDDALSKGDTFLDIGANVGYFSRFASKLVGDAGHVYAFEAEHSNYSALCKNIAHLKNVTSFHFAISNEHKLLKLFKSNHSSSHSMFKTSKNLNGSQFSVPSLTLDYFWQIYLEKRKINLIKIDVEGAELFVLQGMKKMITDNKVESIVLEFHPKIILNTGENHQNLFSLLGEIFDVFFISEKVQDMVKLNSSKELDNIIDENLGEDNSDKLIFYFQRKRILIQSYPL